MTTNEKRVPIDKAYKLRLAQTLDYLRTVYDDLSEGQKQYFDEMLDCSNNTGINEDQQRQLFNMAQRHRGNQTLLIRSKY